MKAEDLLDKLDKASGKNVLPFKKPKKAEGGRIGYEHGDRVGYDSQSRDYDVSKSFDVNDAIELLISGKGNTEFDDPTMSYEGIFDLGNDWSFKGGYYDDARKSPFDVEDEIRGVFSKSFNQGGLIPPQKGPMSDGMGSLFRRK